MNILCFYLSSVLLLGLTPFIYAERNGLTIKLIHRDSIESPLYPGNLTHEHRITRFLHQSRTRANYIASKLEARNKSIDVYHPEQVRPKVHYEAEFYLAEVGIGTFQRVPSYEDYFLVIDTGSSLIWTQCEECEKCFHQDKPLYPYSGSSTYHPLTCRLDGDCGLEGDCRGNLCRYEQKYSGLSVSNGFLGRESLTFSSDTCRPEKADNVLMGCGSSRDAGRPEKVDNILMGCGTSQTGFPFDPRHNKIAGILGIGNDPSSFIQQLGNRGQNRFSHCLPPWSSGRVPNTWLRFGDDSNFRRGQQVFSTPLYKNHGLPCYYLQLQDISIRNVRLNFPPGTFTIKQDGTGGCMIDSGTPMTFIPQEQYNRVTSAVASVIPGHLRVIFEDSYDYCYRKTATRYLPRMIFHFLGADYEVLPEQLFVDYGSYTCLAIVVQSAEAAHMIIGNHMQANYRIMYDLASMQLKFARENCINVH